MFDLDQHFCFETSGQQMLFSEKRTLGTYLVAKINQLRGNIVCNLVSWNW